MDPRKRRWSRRAFLVLTGVAGTAAAGSLAAHTTARLRYAPPVAVAAGSLRLAEGVPAETHIGDHRLRLANGVFTVEDSRGRPLWAAGPDSGLLAAAWGRLDWTETVGHLSSERALHLSLPDQSVDRVDRAAPDGDTGGDTAVLTGRLTSRGSPGTRSADYTLTLRSLDEHRLVVSVDVPDADLVILRLARDPDEGVHGLGAQFTEFDLTGRHVPVIVREQGVGRGREPLTTLAELARGGGGSAETTYAAIPFAVTDSLRAVSVDTHHTSAFDLRPDDRFDIEVWRSGVDATLYSGDAPADLLRLHTEDTGRQEALPHWSGEGAIVGVQGGTEAVREAMASLRGAGAAVTGAWVQDWSGQRRTDFGERLWWNWELDRHRYPDWEELVAELRADGVRMLTYVNPFLVDATGRDEAPRRDLLGEARAAGYLVRAPDGGPYMLDQGGFEAALVDLSHPEAHAWFRDVIVDQVAGAGADGWMADFAESLPMDAVLHGGTAAEWHNRWPVEWARLNDEARKAAGRPDTLVFHRSAGRGSAAHASLFWAGDQTVTYDEYDGLGSAVRGLLSGGVSGMALNHSDAGGYTGLGQPVVGVSRDRELLLRWVETNVWGPVLRTHEGNLPEANAQVYDPDCREAFAEQTRVFAALAEYRRAVVSEAARTGMPVLRHPWLHAPGSRAALRDDGAFLFGPSFFVVPALEAGANEVGTVLPPGRWEHLWSGRRYQGDREVVVEAPLGRPAVFLREGDDAGRVLRERLANLLD